MTQQTASSAAIRRSAIVVAGFATAVSMWGVGFVSRLPEVVEFVPAPALFAVLVGILIAGGAWVGRWEGMRAGAHAGYLASLLNTLVLGSVIASRDGGKGIGLGLTIIGFLVCGAVLGALGGFLGSRRGKPDRDPPAWASRFGGVAIVATLILLAVGGLVTSKEVGLSVPDWPTSFGSNMFLFPLSSMSGGVYFEHSHRLLGSLVGLTTVALAVMVAILDDRRGVKVLAGLAVLAVVMQGVLGGVRVTEGMKAMAVDPGRPIALAHGILAQIFLAMLTSLTILLSRHWREATPEPSEKAAGIHKLTALLVGVMIVQLVLGACLRHLEIGLVPHMVGAALVLLLAVICGVKTLGARKDVGLLKVAAILPKTIVILQVILGFVALAMTGAERPDGMPTSGDVIVSTLHQTTGALLLASCTGLFLLCRRHLTPVADPR